MKKKIFMMLALVMTVMTASAYNISVGTTEKGQMAFMVDGKAVTTAEAGVTVTVKITPVDGYAAKTVTVKAVADWGGAKAPQRRAAINILDNILVERVVLNEYTFEMPEANVVVDAEYTYSAPTEAEEDKAPL